MKKHIILLVFIFGLSASTAFSMNSDPKAENPVNPAKTEKKLSDEEISRLTKRVEEIRDMDKSDLTSAEKIELKKELKETKKVLKNNEPYIYVGGATLILIIILVIILI